GVVEVLPDLLAVANDRLVRGGTPLSGVLGIGDRGHLPLGVRRGLDLLEVQISQLRILEDGPTLVMDFLVPGRRRVDPLDRDIQRLQLAALDLPEVEQLIHPGLIRNGLGLARLCVDPGSWRWTPVLGQSRRETAGEQGDQGRQQSRSCSWHGPPSSMRTAPARRAPTTCEASAVAPAPGRGPYHSSPPATSAASRPHSLAWLPLH